MTELIRDTVFGHALRLVTGGKALPYEEERDPSLWKRFIDHEKTGRMAHHGHLEEEEEEKNESGPGDNDGAGNGRQGSDSAQSPDSNASSRRNQHTGHKIDPEKGKDVNVVGWWGENDQEVSILSKML